jgi:general stress protein 26
MNANIFEKANQIVRTCETAQFGVIDENGFPSVSSVSPVKTQNIFETYFSTGIEANKTKRLNKNNKASVCYCVGGNNITLVGEAEILTDAETKSRYWKDDFIEHFPGGETDPDYVIIKFTTKRVSLCIDCEQKEFTIADLLKIQSRCGSLCDGCPYRKTHNCTGCIAQNGKPFWGECPVATCSQSKNYSHCGECPEIPCDTLKEFSCGNGDPENDEHSDKPPGARIEVCKAWALANKNA